VFDVRSCSDAHLILSQSPSSLTLYEVILGHNSNTRSKIVRYDESEGNGDNLAVTVAEEETLAILDCYESRRFWLSWSNNKIQLKTISSSGRVLLDWYDEQARPVFALSLFTGSGSIGDWKYSYRQG